LNQEDIYEDYIEINTMTFDSDTYTWHCIAMWHYRCHVSH